MRMPPGRKMHEYPKGEPAPLRVCGVAAIILALAFVFFFSMGWIYRVVISSMLLPVVVIGSKLVSSYERNGEAIRIPQVVAISYQKRAPAPIRWARAAFFVDLGLVLILGLAPIPARIAHYGIIGCMLSLFVIGGIHFIAEQHYVNTGVAKEKYDTPSIRS